MSNEADAKAVRISVPNDRSYAVSLKGAQLKFLLSLLEANTYPGKQVFLAAGTIEALQAPLLNEAHGAVDGDD